MRNADSVLAACIWLGSVSGVGLDLAAPWVRPGVIAEAEVERGRPGDQHGAALGRGLPSMEVTMTTHQECLILGISTLAVVFPAVLSPWGGKRWQRDGKAALCSSRVAARGEEGT